MTDHPSDTTPPIASAAPSPVSSKRESDHNYIDAVATLRPKLRVIGDGLQWIIQRFKGDYWFGVAYCQTKEGLLQKLREMLLEDYLSERDAHFPQKAQVLDAKKGRTVKRDRVTREMLDLTAKARAAMKAGDLTRFGVDVAAWATIEALPDHFPKPTNEGGQQRLSR